MFLVDDGVTKLFVDAYLTSAPLSDAAANKPVATDKQLVDGVLKRIGADKVAAVLCGHSHYDHAFDAAYICQQTRAQL